MKYISLKVLILLELIFFLISCSSNLKILDCRYGDCDNASSKNLKVFKNPNNVIVKTIKDTAFISEIRKIKDLIHMENLVPTTTLNYAFILKNDTVYSNIQMQYWYYNGKVLFYNSETLSVNKLDSIFGYIPIKDSW